MPRILHELRKKTDFHYQISDRVELTNVTGRDEKAVKRLASAILKLITPSGVGDQELKLTLDLAVEYRQRVVDWLHFMRPGEYDRKKIGYRVKG